MPYHWQDYADGKVVITLSEEPEYCSALAMAPMKAESKLAHGVWLVMNFAIWSTPDILAIDRALGIAKTLDGAVNLGIRPFHRHDEIRVWCPDVRADAPSPVWLILKDGKLCSEIIHLSSDEVFIDAVNAVLSS